VNNYRVRPTLIALILIIPLFIALIVADISGHGHGWLNLIGWMTIVCIGLLGAYRDVAG
jgi:hypothetical protein